MTRFRPLLALAAAALLAAPAAADDDAASAATVSMALPDTVSARYSGYLLGLKVLNTEIEARFDGDGYDSEALFKTAGVLRWFNEAEIEAEVEGAMDRSFPKPRDYWHVNGASSKDRRIEIDFTGDDVVSTVTPRFGSMGQPPATREERLEAVDGLSAILELALNAGRWPDRPCGYGAKVFDGKQRYDLRVVHKEDRQARLKGYRGPVIACYVYYVPVSGFDPEDLPDEEMKATPLEIWFADTPRLGVYMPVRFSLKLDFGTAVLEARELEVRAGGAPGGSDALE